MLSSHQKVPTINVGSTSNMLSIIVYLMFNSLRYNNQLGPVSSKSTLHAQPKLG